AREVPEARSHAGHPNLSLPHAGHPRTGGGRRVVSPTARSALDRGDRAFLFALVVVALLPRLFVAIAWSREPVWDGHYYHFGAERIAQGLGYSEDVWVNGALEWKPWV